MVSKEDRKYFILLKGLRNAGKDLGMRPPILQPLKILKTQQTDSLNH